MTRFKKWGRKGGRAKTEAKAQAVRQNGLRGGRPKTRTLAERLLRRKISAKQYELVDEAFRLALTREEQEQVLSHFWTHGDSLNTREYIWTSPDYPVRGLVRQFFVEADKRLPKSYIVIWRGVTQKEEDDWDARMASAHRHLGSPPPCPEVRRQRACH